MPWTLDLIVYFHADNSESIISFYLLYFGSFITKRKTFFLYSIRACLKEESEVIRPNQIVNSSLLCEHNQLKYTTHVGGTVFT